MVFSTVMQDFHSEPMHGQHSSYSLLNAHQGKPNKLLAAQTERLKNCDQRVMTKQAHCHGRPCIHIFGQGTGKIAGLTEGPVCLSGHPLLWS